MNWIQRACFYLLICFGGIQMSYSQSHCGTARLMSHIDAEGYYNKVNQLLQSQPTIAQKASGTLQIPVVFHVVYNSAAENLPDSMIYQQLEIMNQDFRRENPDTINTPAAFRGLAGGMDIEFCLAQRDPQGLPSTGIVRVQTSTTVWPSPTTYSVPDPVKHTNQGGSDAWDTEHYINIWICNLSGSTAYSAPPGNFMPDDEGVVCKYQHVGRSHVYPYGEGRSIIHELGHFFCLKHIWGDDQGACTGTDYINDTPDQGNYSTNCPSFPLTDACTPTSPGVMFMNYMDYSEDGCRNMFSQGQCAYMLSCIQSLRPGLMTASAGCTPVVALEELENMRPSIRNIGNQNLEISWAGNPIADFKLYDLRGRVIAKGNGNGTERMVLELTSNVKGILIYEIKAVSGDISRGKIQ